MGITFIFIGLFLWFTMAFNGGVGTDFVNYSFFASGLFMIITGSLAIKISNLKKARIFCSVALVCYLPMIWQRFNFSFGTDWVGLCFDILFVVLMVIFILKKPDKSLKPELP
jgi:hypothetical protein